MSFAVLHCGRMWFRCCAMSRLASRALLERKVHTAQWHGAAGLTSSVLQPAECQGADCKAGTETHEDQEGEPRRC